MSRNSTVVSGRLASGRAHSQMPLVHALTVGPNTRLEFKREDGKGVVDVEVPRAEYAALRDSGVLQSGVTLHLKPRRVRSFSVVNGGQDGRPEFVATDPGALI